MFSFISVKHSVEVSDNQSKVITCIISLLKNVSNARIKQLHGLVSVFFNVEVLSLHLESCVL
jgi:hypothetical protein